LTTNLNFVSKEIIIGHTIVIATHLTKNGCKILSFMVGKGYGVSSSIASHTKEDSIGFTEDMDEAIEMYNSIYLGD